MFHTAHKPIKPDGLVVIHDEIHRCPYIPTQEARMPLEWPLNSVSPKALDRFLDQGYRRSGSFLYRTRCPECSACEPSRVRLEHFQLTRSLRRVLRRGDRDLRVESGSPKVDARRVELFNEHRRGRSLSLEDRDSDQHDYKNFLVETVCETQEMSIWKGSELIAVATTDFGAQSLSLVYCFFDPQYSMYSLGTYSILKHFELAEQTGRTYVYLGMYVGSNQHLRYKARFLPQQRRVKGAWVDFPKGD